MENFGKKGRNGQRVTRIQSVKQFTLQYLIVKFREKIIPIQEIKGLFDLKNIFQILNA